MTPCSIRGSDPRDRASVHTPAGLTRIKATRPAADPHPALRARLPVPTQPERKRVATCRNLTAQLERIISTRITTTARARIVERQGLTTEPHSRTTQPPSRATGNPASAPGHSPLVP